MKALKRSVSLRFLFAAVAGVAVTIVVVLFLFERYQLYQAHQAGWEIVETESGLRVKFGDKRYWNLMRSRLYDSRDVTDLHVIYALEKEEWDFVFSQTKVQSLRLERSRVTPTAISRLGELPSLKQLSFSSCGLQKTHFQAICKLDGLETLALDDAWFSTEGSQEIARLSNLRHLKLGVSDCFLYLPQLKNLESLEYWEGDLPIPTKYLKFLWKLPQLKRLTIRNRPIFGLEDFGILMNCAQLDFIDLRTCQISREGLLHFQALRPNVEVLYDEDLLYLEEFDEPDIVPIQIETPLEQPLPEEFEFPQ